MNHEVTCQSTIYTSFRSLIVMFVSLVRHCEKSLILKQSRGVKNSFLFSFCLLKELDYFAIARNDR